MNNEIKALTIKDAHILFSNFSGRATQYKPEGVRDFVLAIPNDIAAELSEQGWNIRYTRSRDQDEPDQASLRVAVNYNYRVQPEIYKVVGTTKVLLNEETVGQLDRDDIIKVGVRVRPRKWGDETRGGLKAYVEKMYVTVAEDDLDADYNFGVGQDENDSPFN